MAARQMRWMLIFELSNYLLLGLWLQSSGWSATQVLGLCIAVFLGLRAYIVLLSYGFLATGSSPVPQHLQVGTAGMLRMMWEEYIGLFVLFVIIMPYEAYWMGRDRLALSESRKSASTSSASSRPPLLLIHGYQCNRGFWYWLRPHLEAAGWIVATHSLEPVLADIDSYADGVEKRIDEVLAETGATQVILVGHSMGGLVSRAYLRCYGDTKVARMISLGSPHHGSRLAVLGWGPNGKQMRIGNPWLRALESVTLPPGSVSIYSVHDNQVVPQRQCSELPGIRNVAIGGVSHLGMAFSPMVLRTLLDELER
jgi:triacylglycerol lipase